MSKRPYNLTNPNPKSLENLNRYAARKGETNRKRVNVMLDPSTLAYLDSTFGNRSQGIEDCVRVYQTAPKQPLDATNLKQYILRGEKVIHLSALRKFFESQGIDINW